MGFGETFKIQITAMHSAKLGPFSRNDSSVLFIHPSCGIRQCHTASFLGCSRDISPASSPVPFGGLGMSQMPLHSPSLQKLAGRSSYLTLHSPGEAIIIQTVCGSFGIRIGMCQSQQLYKVHSSLPSDKGSKRAPKQPRQAAKPGHR